MLVFFFFKYVLWIQKNKLKRIIWQLENFKITTISNSTVSIFFNKYIRLDQFKITTISNSTVSIFFNKYIRLDQFSVYQFDTNFTIVK